jgi:hypothetical protein
MLAASFPKTSERYTLIRSLMNPQMVRDLLSAVQRYI